MRDRLIELLGKFPVFHSTMKERWMPEAIERLASHLLAEGVIVQAQGHWIEQSDCFDEVLYTCSACRCDWCTIDGTPVENNMRYCPECGAKMSDVIERSNEDAE